ncbi:MAG: hypothetical protein ACTSRA_09815 [Promethearchaeota archaeon]
MLKKLGFQKGLKNINIDPQSHIIYKKTNFSLVVLRPNDLAQMGDLIGQGNRDIIIWIGKIVGKGLAEVIDQEESAKSNQEFVSRVCKNLEYLGFGRISVLNYDDTSAVDIRVDNPIYDGLEENQEFISMIYMGIFLGIFQYLNLQPKVEEIECGWKDENSKHSLFRFTFNEVVAQ